MHHLVGDLALLQSTPELQTSVGGFPPHLEWQGHLAKEGGWGESIKTLTMNCRKTVVVPNLVLSGHYRGDGKTDGHSISGQS